MFVNPLLRTSASICFLLMVPMLCIPGFSQTAEANLLYVVFDGEYEIPIPYIDPDFIPYAHADTTLIKYLAFTYPDGLPLTPDAYSKLTNGKRTIHNNDNSTSYVVELQDLASVHDSPDRPILTMVRSIRETSEWSYSRDGDTVLIQSDKRDAFVYYFGESIKNITTNEHDWNDGNNSFFLRCPSIVPSGQSDICVGTAEFGSSGSVAQISLPKSAAPLTLGIIAKFGDNMRSWKSR